MDVLSIMQKVQILNLTCHLPEKETNLPEERLLYNSLIKGMHFKGFLAKIHPKKEDLKKKIFHSHGYSGPCSPFVIVSSLYSDGHFHVTNCSVCHCFPKLFC